jgi:hypothetical protein
MTSTKTMREAAELDSYQFAVGLAVTELLNSAKDFFALRDSREIKLTINDDGVVILHDGDEQICLREEGSYETEE